jgi:adenine deaminase
MAEHDFSISGNIVDPVNEEIYPGTIQVRGGRIEKISREPTADYDTYLLPGLIDAHIHIESSMLTPSEFARVAAIHGTVATVSDPHEIANVLGIEGVEYMISDGRKVPFKFNFSAPSCVPATPFETSGARLGPEEVEELLDREEIRYLGEVMNFPDVINREKQTLQKIEAARKRGKPCDGLASGGRGHDAQAYSDAGITTDHESFQLEEAREKLEAGLKVIIREGSAARNFDELIPLLEEHYGSCMFCSDDLHPDALQEGHIDRLVRRALNEGYDLMKILQAACVNPVKHYGLEVGLLQEGDPADFIEIDAPEANAFNVQHTFINGEKVAEEEKSLIDRRESEIVNQFKTGRKQAEDFEVDYEGGRLRVIEVREGQLVTEELHYQPKTDNGNVVADPSRDLLKLAVVNRYQDEEPSVAFIKNFGLKSGALASSVAHDSHNIVVVGADDSDMAEAANLVIDKQGGISAVQGQKNKILPLPIAGLISNQSYEEVARSYEKIRSFAGTMGCDLQAPFITLSFMALLVIPKLKLSDKGLFNGEQFEFVSLFEEDMG